MRCGRRVEGRGRGRGTSRGAARARLGSLSGQRRPCPRDQSASRLARSTRLFGRDACPVPARRQARQPSSSLLLFSCASVRPAQAQRGQQRVLQEPGPPDAQVAHRRSAGEAVLPRGLRLARDVARPAPVKAPPAGVEWVELEVERIGTEEGLRSAADGAGLRVCFTQKSGAEQRIRKTHCPAVLCRIASRVGLVRLADPMRRGCAADRVEPGTWGERGVL